MPREAGDRHDAGRLAVTLSIVLAAPVAAQTQLVSVATYGNFHTAGVVATLAGDADGDASATLEYRRTGDPSFRPAQPLVRVDSTRLVGSLFGLSVATAYEVRVTLADPDGVAAGAQQTAAVTTRGDLLPEPTARTLYVATNGNDGNPGTLALPLRTVQRAETLATPGTLVLIQPGIYREEVSVDVAGTAAQPIVFRGNGMGVVLDGADATIAAGTVPWTPETAGVYALATGFTTDHVVGDQGRFYRYATVAALRDLDAGPPGGFHFDGATLRVKFADGSSPAQRTLHVARRENGFHLQGGAAFVRIENVEIRHYGSGGFGKGVYLNRVNDAVVRSCRIHEVQSAGVWIKGGNRHLIEDNRIWDTSIFGWPWDLVKGSSAENNAVAFTNEAGRGNVVRRNLIDGTFNGIAPCGSEEIAGFTTETDVHHNQLTRHLDDAVEPEGWCANVRLFGNRVRDVHMAFAVAPAHPGPTWLVRNVAHDFGNTRASQVDGWSASALKINSGYPEAVGPLLLLHNTFLTTAPGTSAIALFNPGASTYVRARNNLFAGTDYVLYKVNPVALDWQGDDLYTTRADRFVRWHTGTHYPDLAALRAGTGLEDPDGMSAPPQLVSPAAGRYEPAPGSPLLDAGVPLANVNDEAVGAPDVGAFERGAHPSPPTDLHTVPPCRLVDTRNAAGPRGGPQLFPLAHRTLPLAGVCGVPASARAVVLNATAVSPAAGGNLTLYPGNQEAPDTLAVAFVAGQNRAAMAVVPLATDGTGTLAVHNASPGTVHLVLDVSGYFE